MSDNVQKYKNWRAITESDYVTMFIKTWFAFVATLREMYPKDNLRDVIGKGDKVYLTPYLDDFENIYFQYNVIDKIKENILNVYKLGRKYTLENKKYNRFFFEDFYEINTSYLWGKIAEDYECSIKYSAKNTISFHVKYLDKDLELNNEPLIITEKIDVSDLTSSEFLNDNQINHFLDDEAAYIAYVADIIADRVSNEFVSKITKEHYEDKYTLELFNRFNAVTLLINNDLKLALTSMKDPYIQKENLLLTQSPCNNFIYLCEDGADIPKIDTYKWFLNFVYFMRNALFHEIIDPLDAFWQEIFKHSYLVLKEILDGNINYFLEKERVKSLIFAIAWDEFSKKKDVYIPNYNENNANGDLEILIKEYEIKDSFVQLKAELSLDYWYDEHTLKRMKAKCNAKINRTDTSKSEFKMNFIKLEDV